LVSPACAPEVAATATPAPAAVLPLDQRLDRVGRPGALDRLGTAAVVRIVAWAFCVIFCVGSWLNYSSILSYGTWDTVRDRWSSLSAIQEASVATGTLVTMFLAFVIARAVDGATRTR